MTRKKLWIFLTCALTISIILPLILLLLIKSVDNNCESPKDIGKYKQARKAIKELADGITMYQLENESFPDKIEDLVTKDIIKSKEHLMDPWDRYYIYELKEDRYIITSLGSDGKLSDDIVYEKKMFKKSNIFNKAEIDNEFSQFLEIRKKRIKSNKKDIKNSTYVLKRDFLKNELHDLTKMTKEAMLVNEIGKGIVILGFKDNSFLDVLGFKEHDTIESINNFDISDPIEALLAYQKLPNVDQFSIKIVRQGEKLTLQYKVKD